MLSAINDHVREFEEKAESVQDAEQEYRRKETELRNYAIGVAKEIGQMLDNLPDLMKKELRDRNPEVGMPGLEIRIAGPNRQFPERFTVEDKDDEG